MRMMSSQSGCFSMVGMTGSARQKINLAPRGCTQVGTAIHEIFHALGMAHEQSRPDRDRHVTVHWQNIQGNMKHNFEIMRGADTKQRYDPGSLMHFGTGG